jgi:transposase
MSRRRIAYSPAVVSGASSRRTPPRRPGLEERPGVIKIDLADGVRLRVDAFVNERALRRVLAVLKVAS